MTRSLHAKYKLPCGSLYFSAFITKFDSLSLNVFIKSLDSLTSLRFIKSPNSLWLSILIRNSKLADTICIYLNRRLATVFNVNLCNKLVLIYYLLSKIYDSLTLLIFISQYCSLFLFKKIIMSNSLFPSDSYQ